MGTVSILKPIVVPVMVALAFFASLVQPVEAVILSVEETEEGTKFEGTVQDLDWTAVLREIKTIDGGRFRKVKLHIKGGDREETVEVDLDARSEVNNKKTKSILDSIRNYVNHQHKKN